MSLISSGRRTARLMVHDLPADLSTHRAPTDCRLCVYLEPFAAHTHAHTNKEWAHTHTKGRRHSEEGRILVKECSNGECIFI